MDFPTTPGAFDTTFNGVFDAFVTSLNAAGSMLVYSTYLGGSSSGDQGFGIAVDSDHNAYVTGVTGSLDFPTTPGAFDTTFNGVFDAFVTKLDLAPACPPNDDDDNDGLIDANEPHFHTLLGNVDSDGDGIVDGNDDANGNGVADEDDDDECPDLDDDGNGTDDEDEDDY